VEDQIYWMNCWKWLDTFEIISLRLNRIESHAQDGCPQGENQSWHVDTLTWWWLRAMAFGLKEINSSDSNSVIIWSWFNMYVVLLREMLEWTRDTRANLALPVCIPNMSGIAWSQQVLRCSQFGSSGVSTIVKSFKSQKSWQSSGVLTPHTLLTF
jgi:hypothetical protein